MNDKKLTYWNNLLTPAVRGTAVVADAPYFLDYWAKKEGLIGTRIDVVQIILDRATYPKCVFYLDNRDGFGWEKVTTHLGSPYYRHANLEVEPDSFKEE